MEEEGSDIYLDDEKTNVVREKVIENNHVSASGIVSSKKWIWFLVMGIVIVAVVVVMFFVFKGGGSVNDSFVNETDNTIPTVNNIEVNNPSNNTPPVSINYPRSPYLDENKNTLQIYRNNVSCVAAGGHWGRYNNGYGNASMDCNLNTTDAGNICNSSIQCESYCAVINQSQDYYTENRRKVIGNGECYKSTIYICLSVLDNSGRLSKANCDYL